MKASVIRRTTIVLVILVPLILLAPPPRSDDVIPEVPEKRTEDAQNERSQKKEPEEKAPQRLTGCDAVDGEDDKTNNQDESEKNGRDNRSDYLHRLLEGAEGISLSG